MVYLAKETATASTITNGMDCHINAENSIAAGVLFYTSASKAQIVYAEGFYDAVNNKLTNITYISSAQPVLSDFFTVPTEIGSAGFRHSASGDSIYFLGVLNNGS